MIPFTLRCEATGKRCYRSERQAKRARTRHIHDRLRAYRCAFCGRWHLTHLERRSAL